MTTTVGRRRICNPTDSNSGVGTTSEPNGSRLHRQPGDEVGVGRYERGRWRRRSSVPASAATWAATAPTRRRLLPPRPCRAVTASASRRPSTSGSRRRNSASSAARLPASNPKVPSEPASWCAAVALLAMALASGRPAADWPWSSRGGRCGPGWSGGAAATAWPRRIRGRPLQPSVGDGHGAGHRSLARGSSTKISAAGGVRPASTPGVAGVPSWVCGRLLSTPTPWAVVGRQ